jgi:predicted HTH transcriptional regulator
MMNLSDDICRNRHGNEPESQKAHQRTLPNKMQDRSRIIAYLTETGGHTAEEIERALKIHRSTVSARMSEMKRDGLIEKIGRRSTSTGSSAGVYDVPRDLLTWNVPTLKNATD